jgi:hypothetical protein
MFSEQGYECSFITDECDFITIPFNYWPQNVLQVPLELPFYDSYFTLMIH